MSKQILVVYKSVTGFTKQYAQWIGESLDCETAELKDVTASKMAAYDLVIFGGRFHAGFVDGLKKAKALVGDVRKLIVFATGASPSTMEDMVKEAWGNNFTPEELAEIPHFYMQGGLRYEKMPLGDKLMMKAFGAMVKGKKDKTAYEEAMSKVIGKSYDLSSKAYTKPLIDYVKSIGSQ